MEEKWNEYLKTLTAELGKDTAALFIQSLKADSQAVIGTAEKFFYALGRTWSPLMHHWAEWIQSMSRQKTTALILRDAKPLEGSSRAAKWKRLYLNRQNCGIADEISGHAGLECHPLLKRYLAQEGCADAFTFVDSGCYGSIVLELHRIGFHFDPLFFFSKNPRIPGFLNEIGVSEKDGEVLNDSLECAFPNIHLRPDRFVEVRGRVEPSLEHADTLSVLFGNAALAGVKENPPSATDPLTEARKLIELSRRAHAGEFTGILGNSSPEWSGKTEFLENWPGDLSW